MKIVHIGNTEADKIQAAAVKALRDAGHTVALPVNAMSKLSEFARLLGDADELHIWTLDRFLLGMAYLAAYDRHCPVKLFCGASEEAEVRENRMLAAFISLGATLEVVT